MRPRRSQSSLPQRALPDRIFRAAGAATPGCWQIRDIGRAHFGWLFFAIVLPWGCSVTGTSAAQNGPVIQICSQCGALLLEDADRCSFCDASLVENDEILQPVAAGSHSLSAEFQGEDRPLRRDPAIHRRSASAVAEEEPEWRREVSRRLDDYRARRRRLHADDSQSGLPFAAGSDFDEEEAQEREIENTRARERAAQQPVRRTAQRPRQNERVEICIQPELDFASSAHERAHPQTALVPVASLAERRTAGLLDGIFLALTYAGFLGLFRSLGGQLYIEKVDAAVYLATFFLFYAQYFFLFTSFAGATPGMQLRQLTIVRLDGSIADPRQLLWRSFGYLLSGATLGIGFFWSLWDEDRFTWQDRISQTYITAGAPLSHASSFDLGHGQERFAHK